MSYANTKIRLDFPDLSEQDDPIFVTIRNPKTITTDRLTPKTDVALDADGRPVDTDQATTATYDLIAGMIVDWHVYDADSDDGDPLPLPATAELLRKLPFEIVRVLMEQVTQVVALPR